MSNTIFDVKQAVKHMLDGLTVIDIQDSHFFVLTDRHLFRDLNDEEDYWLDVFMNTYRKQFFRLENKHLVEWYRPLIFCTRINNRVYLDQLLSSEYFRNKDGFFERYGDGIKVLDWEVTLLPATYNECD